MDPNANLERLLELVGKMLDPTRSADPDDASEMAELVYALDTWIKHDGFLPRVWTGDKT